MWVAMVFSERPDRGSPALVSIAEYTAARQNRLSYANRLHIIDCTSKRYNSLIFQAFPASNTSLSVL